MFRVLLGSVLHRKPWRYDQMDESVQEGSEDNLMYMLGQHGEVEPFREGPHPFAEGRDGRYREGVFHGCGAAADAFKLDIWKVSIDEGWQPRCETGRSLRAHTRRRADLIRVLKPSVTFGDSASLGSSRESGQAHDQVTQIGNDVRSQRLRIRWELHATVEVRVAAARALYCAVGLGDQEAEKMQDESLKFKTDGARSRKHADVVCHVEMG